MSCVQDGGHCHVFGTVDIVLCFGGWAFSCVCVGGHCPVFGWIGTALCLGGWALSCAWEHGHCPIFGSVLSIVLYLGVYVTFCPVLGRVHFVWVYKDCPVLGGLTLSCVWECMHCHVFGSVRIVLCLGV